MYAPATLASDYPRVPLVPPGYLPGYPWLPLATPDYPLLSLTTPGYPLTTPDYP